MKFSGSFLFDFEKNNSLYFRLLKEEDFNFKTKDIKININETNKFIEVKVDTKSILELKIANNALIKSIEIIAKTLNI